MVYSRAHDHYVPVFYILLQSKSESTYYYALQSAICATDWRFEASTVTCDFEQSLIKAIKDQFPSATPVLCLFHWKQALKRKLKTDFKLPDDVVRKLIGKNGLLDMLTVIPIREIDEFGIPYIQSKMIEDEANYGAQLSSFWKYFRRTWITMYDPKDWNVHDVVSNNDEDFMINRTNNPLERYNRTMNNKFPVAHPSMVNFVTSIREESQNFVKSLEYIKKG